MERTGGSGLAGRLGLMVNDLSVERGGRTVISGLSFEVKAGEVLLVTGPNGSGKTTLLRTLAGFVAPLRGNVRVIGGADDHPLAGQLHYVGHLNGVRSSLTVAENASFWERFLGGSGVSVLEALVRFGLEALAEVPAAYLSAGQRRRLGLTRLVLAQRAVWLLDEPTTSLDAASTKLVTDLINEHSAGGGLAIVATHSALDVNRARELRLGGRATP